MSGNANGATSLQIEYRTAASFLMAYTVSYARGAVFVETERDIAIGTPIALQLAIPDHGLFDLTGVCRFRRPADDEDGPPGVGIELSAAYDELGEVVDRLSLEYDGVSVLLLAGDNQERTSLTRLLKSIVTTAEVVSATDAHLAEAVLDDDIDLAILDGDFDAEAALQTISAARDMPIPVPTIALVSASRIRDRLRAAGADEVATNPPPLAELQQVLVRALARPKRVR